MDAYLLQAIHHISVSAARIKKNNDALRAEQDAAPPRDQGFTRAKVLPRDRLRVQGLGNCIPIPKALLRPGSPT